ncbi:MAG: hypothetical protein HY925_12490, partial [Elusimicrobia bacterium]|nr:hypothetical protein [Elusimicrobiota bacterium]
MSRRSASRAGKKLRAVAGVLAAVALVGVGLRRLLLSSASPPAPPTPREPRHAPPPGRPAPDSSAPAWPQEQPYAMLSRVDPVLAPAIWGLFSASPSSQKTAALELAGHFVASDTLTGLCPEAADTLWVLSEAVRRKAALQTTLDQLYRDLHRLADLEDYEKDDFVDQLADPLAVYVPLAVSHAPHVRESRRMVSQFRRLL